ncbi:MAG: Unknown protein [uncultured Campylobacterales bacterium]|uniref:Uncharacterized protein n=1 Tax=uncultured Campylobacterales bacterium TaxID=352960 RepID=A0A6S6SMT4_9BACT|nr:MAG: Unknown protein [uncultured Campylobacterales bacterium]
MKKFAKMLGLSVVGLLGISSSASAVTVSASDIDFTTVIASIGVVTVALIGLGVTILGARKIVSFINR